jgi:N utilization substance protein B
VVAIPKPAKSPPRGRTFARVAAVQALFQADQTGDPLDLVIDQFVRHRLNQPAGGTNDEDRLPDADIALFARIVHAAAAQAALLDELIAASLPADWPLARLDAVLRSLLRAGAAELAEPEGPPSRVIINEYLDVAHAFFSGDEAKLVNGVLDRLAHELRAAEFS